MSGLRECSWCEGEGYVDYDGFGTESLARCEVCDGTGKISEDGTPLPPRSTAANMQSVAQLKAWRASQGRQRDDAR